MSTHGTQTQETKMEGTPRRGLSELGVEVRIGDGRVEAAVAVEGMNAATRTRHLARIGWLASLLERAPEHRMPSWRVAQSGDEAVLTVESAEASPVAVKVIACAELVRVLADAVGVRPPGTGEVWSARTPLGGETGSWLWVGAWRREQGEMQAPALAALVASMPGAWAWPGGREGSGRARSSTHDSQREDGALHLEDGVSCMAAVVPDAQAARRLGDGEVLGAAMASAVHAELYRGWCRARQVDGETVEFAVALSGASAIDDHHLARLVGPQCTVRRTTCNAAHGAAVEDGDVPHLVVRTTPAALETTWVRLGLVRTLGTVLARAGQSRTPPDIAALHATYPKAGAAQLLLSVLVCDDAAVDAVEATLGAIASARWLAPKRLDRDLWCVRVHLDGRPASAYAGVIADAHEQARWRDAEAVVALLRRRVRERAGEATRH